MPSPAKRKPTDRPDVMISSTSLDLVAHRETVKVAIWRVGLTPIMMERDETEPHSDAIKYSLEMVDQVKVYLGIFGYRYGYIPDDPRNPDRLSITELEYREALKQNLPMLLFVMSDKHLLLRDHVDTDPEKVAKLKALKDDICTNHIVSFFDSVEDLRSKTLQLLYGLKYSDMLDTPSDDDETAVTIGDLQSSIVNYKVLLGVGDKDGAGWLYRFRLSRVLLHKMGAYHIIIELLTPLFSDGIPDLSDSIQQSYVTKNLAYVLFLLGRTHEAQTLYGQMLKLDLDAKKITNLGRSLRSYAAMLHDDNRLAASLQTLSLARDLAEVVEDQDELARIYLYLLGLYKDSGRWAEAEEAYTSLKADLKTHPSLSSLSTAEQYRAEMLICQGLDAVEILDKTERLARLNRTPHMIEWLRGEVALRQGKPDAADEHFQCAVAITRKLEIVYLATFLSCLARARTQQGRHDEAREIIGEALAHPYEVGVLGLYNSAAEVYLALGERDKAKEYAIKAYKEAWADGPPHIWWWGLERAKKVLDELGVPYPDMPPFDPAKVKPIPYEDEIRAFIAELKAEKANKPDEDI